MLTPHQAQQLLAALLEDYPGEYITGYLLNARTVGDSLVGQVYKAPGQPPGTPILAQIDVIVDYGRRYLVRANGYDCFVIVSFHPQGGRRSLRQTLALFDGALRLGSRYTHH